MTLFTKPGVAIASPVTSGGIARPVDNLDMQVWMTEVETVVKAFTSSGGLVYDTRANLYADLAHDANTQAWVIADSTVAYNGIYRKAGASGSGSWSRVADLPYSFIRAIDAGAGTPNAIEATTAVPLPVTDGGALVYVNIFQSNTGSPVTIAFNGGSPLTIKRQRGGDFLADELPSSLLGFVSGSTFQSIFDVPDESTLAAIAAIATAFGDLDAARSEWEAAVADAQLAQAGAEAARDSTWTAADYFASSAAGLSGTSEGDTFRAPTSDGLGWQLYRHDAGPVATAIGDPMPNKAYIDQIAITEFSVVRCVDPDYDGITIVDANGNILSASPIASWAAVLVSNAVKAINTETGQVLTVSWQRSGTRYVGGVDNAKSKLTYGNDVSGMMTPFSEWLDYRIDVSGGVTTLRYVPWHGQSLGMGDQATPVLSAPASGLSRALGFNDGSRVINAYATSTYASTRLPEEGIRYVVPIFEDVDGLAGEAPCSGFAKWLADARPSTEAILSATVAVGGTSYTTIKSGTVSYDNLLRTVRRGAFIAACNGLAFDVPAVCWKHGETNSLTSEATYKGYMTELSTDLKTDIQAITGQASGPVLVTSQFTSWGKFSATQSGAALALLTAAIENPNDIICAGPDYILDHAADNVHLSAIGSLHSGEYYARAVKEFIANGSWLPLYPTAAVRTGDTIVVTFNVPVQPIVLDTSTLTNPGNYGIEWIDNGDGNSPTISSVTVTDDDELTVVLSTTPTGTGQKLGFARTTTLGVGSDINVGPRTNIRDSSTDVSVYDASALYNWCCVSEIAVTA